MAIKCLAALAEEAERNAGLRPQSFIDGDEQRLRRVAQALDIDNIADERRDRRDDLADKRSDRTLDPSLATRWWDHVTLTTDEISEELVDFIETLSKPGPTWRLGYTTCLRQVIDILHELPTEESAMLPDEEVEILSTVLISSLIAESLNLLATSMILGGAEKGISAARLARVGGGSPRNPSDWLTGLTGKAKYARPGRPRKYQ